MGDFVHLHVHSEYSLLDGMGKTPALAAQAAKLGQPALALTDHGVLHGAVEFFRACRKERVKPIIGVEAYLTPFGRKMTDRDPNADKVRHHLLLLAQNMTGYRNLLKLCSDAQLNGFYYRPRVDADYLAAHADGLICTTGCMAAEIPYLLKRDASPGSSPRQDLALERLQWYIDVFGRDRFFVELQEHSIPELTRINATLFDWAQRFDLNLVVTNDVHYVTAADAQAHDTLLCVQTSSLTKEPSRMRMSDNGYYLKSLDELKAVFSPMADLPASAFSNTLKIAEMCQIDLEDSTFHLPDLPPGSVPPGYDYDTYLRLLTETGLQNRYQDRASEPEIQARKEHELKIIGEMGFAVYFLIVWDMCEYARRRNIWWNVRGSGAGSIVAYALGITMMDPLQNGLIFERFLNPGRVSMPDFDLDYPDDQREEMIRYTIDRYGSDRVAQIVAFGRMKARAAIRDIGRAMDIPLPEVDTLAKQIAAVPGKPATITHALDPDHEFFSSELKAQYENVDYVQELIDTAQQLEAVARHASVHAAAVIITDRPLTEYVPLMRPPGSVITEAITQFEYPICESIGLLKVDFLGLSTLTIMRKATELIADRHGIDLNLNNIPTEDPQAFELMAQGNVTGVFQLEGQGMRRILKEMRPNKFGHIIALLSLYRPGPMQYIPNFIKRMHGEEEVTYRHPALEPILEETYGIIVYQEQIMRIATDLAGYAASEADFMRQAVAKKKAKELKKHKQMMIKGGRERGIAAETMEQIYADIEFFARYGFNKAHAADYAVITCQTAYLKAHYPVEYMTALLTVERNNTEKVGVLIGECRAMGIDIRPPDVNYSGSDFIIEIPAGDEKEPMPPAIRFGLGAVKNVGQGPVETILESRRNGDPFRDIDDFCSRVDLRQVNRRALESLIKVGALRDFGARARLLAIIDRMIGLSGSTHRAAAVGQMSMFDLGGFDAPQTGSILYPLPDVEEVSRREKLGWEKELVGVYVSEHPIQFLLSDIGESVTCFCGELDSSMHGQVVTVAGLLNSVRQIYTRKGDPMAFAEIEDLQGTLEVVIFPRVYREYQALLQEETVILVRGRVDASRGNFPKVLADSITTTLTRYQAANDQELTGKTSSDSQPPLPPVEPRRRPVEPVRPSVSDTPAPPTWDEPAPADRDPPAPVSAPAPASASSKPNGQTWPYQPAWPGSGPAATSGTDDRLQVSQAEPAKPHSTESAKCLHITVPRTGDLATDKRRLQQVYQTLQAYPGQDRFCLYIPNGPRRVQVDFPNSLVKDSAQLRQRLITMLGAGTVRVEQLHEND
jgi:DNA polymerase III subunit alpha